MMGAAGVGTGSSGEEETPDAYYDNTILLIQPPSDATDGSTNIIDASYSARTVTVSGDVQIDTVDWGYPTVIFDGTTDDYLSVPDNDVFDLLMSHTMTLEFLFQSNDVGTRGMNMASKKSAVGGDAWRVQTWTDGAITIEWYDNGSTRYWIWAEDTGILDGNLHHVEITLSSSVFRVYIDGVFIASKTMAAQIKTNSQPVYIGANQENMNFNFIGSLRARFTYGVARHTTTDSFTPPTSFALN